MVYTFVYTIEVIIGKEIRCVGLLWLRRLSIIFAGGVINGSRLPTNQVTSLEAGLAATYRWYQENEAVLKGAE